MIYGLRRMIYLLRKRDIISVLSYAEGIYHRTKCDIISKIYHPFRKERISLQKAIASAIAFCMAERMARILNTPSLRFVLYLLRYLM